MSGVYYVANLESEFGTFFVTSKGWCSGDSCLDDYLLKVGRLTVNVGRLSINVGRLTIWAESCVAEQVFGGRHLALEIALLYNRLVRLDNGRMICLFERQTVP